MRARTVTAATPCLVTIITIALAAAACTGRDETAPVAESGTQATRALNEPTTVTGCLRAGDAADTFVLATLGEQPVTYSLTGDTRENLRDQIGRQVEVTGVVTAEQRTATRGSGTAEDQPQGTSGTPTVQTQTQVNIRELEVNSIRPLGQECR